jgi:hypothetical protein
MPFTIFFKEHISGIEYPAWVPSHVTVDPAAVVPTGVPPAVALVSRAFLFPLWTCLSTVVNYVHLSMNCGLLCALVDELRTSVWICDGYYYI